MGVYKIPFHVSASNAFIWKLYENHWLTNANQASHHNICDRLLSEPSLQPLFTLQESGNKMRKLVRKFYKAFSLRS